MKKNNIVIYKNKNEFGGVKKGFLFNPIKPGGGGGGGAFCARGIFFCR